MSERHSRWLFFSLLTVQFVLLSAQVPGGAEHGSLLEKSALRIVAPIARLVGAPAEGLSTMREKWRSRRQLLADNEELRQHVQELKKERIRLFGVEKDLERLSAAVDYVADKGGRLWVADVVHLDYRSWLRTLVIHVSRGVVKPDQPVVTGEGLLGRVVVVAGDFAEVQIITDRAASVGAMIERTRRQGIVRGAEDGLLELDFVPLQEDVRPGDGVVSAGIDGVYPRGLPIGTISSVEPGNELFHRIRVVPAVDFGRLDQVFVLERETVPEVLLEGADARP